MSFPLCQSPLSGRMPCFTLEEATKIARFGEAQPLGYDLNCRQGEEELLLCFLDLADCDETLQAEPAGSANDAIEMCPGQPEPFGIKLHVLLFPDMSRDQR